MDTISLLRAAQRKVKLGTFYQFDVANFNSKTVAWVYQLMLINFKSRKLSSGWVVKVRGFNPETNSNLHLSTYITEQETKGKEALKPVIWAVSNLPNEF